MSLARLNQNKNRYLQMDSNPRENHEKETLQNSTTRRNEARRNQQVREISVHVSSLNYRIISHLKSELLNYIFVPLKEVSYVKLQQRKKLVYTLLSSDRIIVARIAPSSARAARTSRPPRRALTGARRWGPARRSRARSGAD